jgi:hypothetical protein
MIGPSRATSIMKWFQFDSDTPDDLKIRALMLKGGATAFGHWSLLLCHVARKGKGTPGEGVRKDGSRLDLEEMAIACGFEDAVELTPFLDRLAKLKLIDGARWATEQVVYLPAMATRADEYSKKKARRSADESADTPDDSGKVSGEKPDSPVVSVLLVPEESFDLKPGEVIPIEKNPVDALVHLWNLKAAPGLPRVSKITDERRRAWRAALGRHPNLADWERAIVFLNGSDWWTGRGPKGNGHDQWTGDLEYLAKPGKLQKALEQADAKGRAGDGTGIGTGHRPGHGATAAADAAKRGRVAPVPGKYAGIEDD